VSEGEDLFTAVEWIISENSVPQCRVLCSLNFMRQLDENVGGLEALHGKRKLSSYGDDDYDNDDNNNNNNNNNNFCK
jgi:hypothetical protein